MARLGDLQGAWHLKNIFEVCKLTPDTMHWLPTQERKFLPLNTDSIPKNLIIRLSNAKNDTEPGRPGTTGHRGDDAASWSRVPGA